MSSVEEQKQLRFKMATEVQRKAANPQKSVWVEANAGTGKTKVLSDRVLRLLLKGVNPNKILCLTYTKAAAVQMRNKISEKLAEWAALSDEKLSLQLVKLLGEEVKNVTLSKARQLFAVLLEMTDGMKIQTIHSFCQEVLKRFPLEAKISPYFDVMTDRESSEALNDLKKKLFVEAQNNPNGEVAKALGFLVANVKEAKFSETLNFITDNRSKIISLLQKYTVADVVQKLADTLGVADGESVERLKQNFMQQFDLAAAKNIMSGLRGISVANLWQIDALESMQDKYEFCKNIFLTGSGKVRSATAKLSDSQVIQAYALAQTFVDLEEKIAALNLFYATKNLLILAQELIDGYAAIKHRIGKLDYEDLIVLTLNLLSNPAVREWVLFKLDEGIDHVLIDEAQDTSPLQWQIIKALTEDFFVQENEPRTLFVVGDKKQSIYSFQGADAVQFEKMRQFFLAMPNFEEVNLSVSFRSVTPVLESVDKVFALPEAKEGVAANVQHAVARLGEAGKVEIWDVIESPKEDEKENSLLPEQGFSAQSAGKLLAQKIAQKIKNMVQSGEVLESKKRPINYADFLILVRTRDEFVEALIKECKNLQINVSGLDRMKLLDQLVVKDMLAIAKFLLLPTDDLMLATVLKTPIFNLTDDDLLELCYNRKFTLWHALGQNAKYAETYAELQKLLNLADFVRPYELFMHILINFDGFRKIKKRLGEESTDALQELLNLTLVFEQEYAPTLQKFVEWVELDEIEVKRELEQGKQNMVRIMTIHGSKGLQAPIVILPDMVKTPSAKRVQNLLWDDVFYFPLSAAYYEKQCSKIFDAEQRKTIEEYHRLLYVALTRAEDRVYICGYKKKRESKEQNWYDLCKTALTPMMQQVTDGVLCYQNSCQNEKLLFEKDKAEPKTEVPNWLWQKAKAESPTALPLKASKLGNEDEEEFLSPLEKTSENCYKRGTIIHKLLQFLPAIEANIRKAAATEFVVKNGADFSVTSQSRMVDEVINLVENSEFSELFSVAAKSEVPIMGEVDGKIIAGQIDRLLVTKDKVAIIDYKTNRPAANCLSEVPEQYIKQLQAYALLLQQIYQNKKVEAYILWTDIASLMKII